METIRMKDLEQAVRVLNGIHGFKEPKWNTVDSFHLSGAYGGYQLQQIVNDGGGVRVISSGGYVSKRELYYQVNTAINLARITA